MAQLAIPQRFDQTFEFLFSLSTDKVNELIKLAGDVSKDFSSEEAINDIAKKSGIKSVKIEKLFELFLNLIAIKELNDYETNAYIEELLKALEERDIKFSPKNVKENLILILENRESSFYIKTKSLLLASENANLFLNARILSDIRPVFGDQVEDQFLGSIILHQLKINFRSEENRKEIHLTLDSNDLSKLKEQITRAEKKEKAIRKQLVSSSIRIFNLNE